ncbi:MAG: LysR family transcriptional regulator [Peptococcaceae bacterium]|nr:LysR family transcriptional regulator [Peptococcaceae bacterium]
MELNQLKYFVLIAELQNLSKAAEKLNISQPSLSKSISRLEKELGTPLFDRKGKKIVLNEQGRIFLTGVREALQGLEDITAVVGNFSKEYRVRLNLGIFCSQSLIISYLQEFAQKHDNVDFNINCNIASIEHLDTDYFDMMIYPLDADAVFKKYKGHVLTHERFKLVVNRKHPLAGQKAVEIEDLQDEQFVFIQHSRRRIEQPYHLCVSRGVKPRIKYTTNSLESHRQIIAYNLAIGFMAEGNAEFYFSNPELVILDIKDKLFVQTVMIGFKREKHLSETAKLFRDFIMDHIQISPDK